MKNALLFLLMLLPAWCRADHFFGVDLYYSHVSGNTYKVYMTVYGNCGANNWSDLPTVTPEILLINNGSITRTMYLKLIPDSTRNVNPYCRSQQGNTKCNGGPLLGVNRFIYADTVTIPYPSVNWLFRFTSNMNTSCGSRAGRPVSGTNWVGGNNSRLVLEATLNNSAGNNSSPKYNSSVFDFYCINVPQTYNQQATDPDNDSLSYSLVQALEQATCTLPQNVTYQPGYSYSNPLAVVANSLTFDNATGTLKFTPNLSQESIVDTKISEYRNGVLVGTAMREKVFYVLSSCNNQPPTGDIDTAAAALQGGFWSGTDTITTCPGSTVRFHIPVRDANGDSIKAGVANIPSGSSVTISNNNSTQPRIDFAWNTTGMPAGNYTFLGNYSDNGCPLSTSNVMTYTIRIIDGGKITPAVLSSTDCIHKAGVQFQLQNGLKPYTLTLMQGNNTIKTYTDTSGLITDSLATGAYTLQLKSAGLACTSQATLVVADSGVYPYIPKGASPIDYCRDAPAAVLTAQADSGTILKWYDAQGNNLPGAPTPATNIAGTFTWYITEQYKTCESGRDTIVVHVSQDECNYDITIHNVITPNGDGKNDNWIIENLSLYPKSTIQLYDKLGDKVFDQTNYQGDWTGGNLPSGVYYYYINLKEPNKTTGREIYTGYLMINR
ncbi:gliding motility-associated C-terminal domain-containing protein [Chitinophagaceae bacterium MMS25-I14]